jgi:hypothetical protein
LRNGLLLRPANGIAPRRQSISIDCLESLDWRELGLYSLGMRDEKAHVSLAQPSRSDPGHRARPWALSRTQISRRSGDRVQAD